MTSLMIAAIAVLAAAPAARQEEERDEHQVEEDDEQREVLRHQRAEHRVSPSPSQKKKSPGRA